MPFLFDFKIREEYNLYINKVVDDFCCDRQNLKLFWLKSIATFILSENYEIQSSILISNLLIFIAVFPLCFK